MFTSCTCDYHTNDLLDINKQYTFSLTLFYHCKKDAANAQSIMLTCTSVSFLRPFFGEILTFLSRMYRVGNLSEFHVIFFCLSHLLMFTV